jgi:hypothetical protein
MFAAAETELDMSTQFSRTNPSPRYQELQSLYRSMHEQGERFLGIPPEATFSGISLLPQAPRIKRLIDLSGARSILDYGSGKGSQYAPQPLRDQTTGSTWIGIQHYWGVDSIVCYDPCYVPHSRLPAGQFDGVISTDVLEHCPEADIPWIVGEIFAYASRFVFANVACYPARKRLPNGENAHCTIKPVAWWKDLLTDTAASHPDLRWEVWIQFVAADGQTLAEEKIGNV